MTESLGGIADVGTSLGSFSVTAALLEALTAEFAKELDAKRGCFDSDPHWWMPMTLPLDAYVALMAKKGIDAVASTAHHGRVRAMLQRFDDGGKHLLGPVWKSNLQPDFNVSVIERIAPDSSAVLRELDESNRFVQKSAESTSI